ncbi:MAG: hypothetical protein HOV92_12480 [Streptomyces sp.]|nr:hypothetical protein [Streptomyces sp.]
MTTTLIDFQHELGGVLIGAQTLVQIKAIEGLGLPEFRTQDVAPPTEDGLWLGVDYAQGRTVRIDAAVRAAGDPAAVLDTIATLQSVADDTTVRLQGGAYTLLRLKFPGRDVRVVRGRLRKAAAETDRLIHGYAPLDLEFQATDHVFYSDDEQSTSIPLGVIEGGGFTAPVIAPIIVGGTGDSRPGRIDVDGTAPAWPVLTVNGPCANPRITHVETGRVLELRTTIPAGQYVVIDTRPTVRTVTRSGGGTLTLTPASRIDAFSLPAGASELQWTANDPTNTSSLSVRWAPAWTAL